MKRLTSILIAGALASAGLSAAPAAAQEAPPVPEVPAEPNIVDPTGDANYLNDQGFGGLLGVVPREGDHTTPADAASVSDIKAVWFTADKDSVSAHIHTEAPPPATASTLFRVQVNPGGGNSSSCLWFQAWMPGAGNVTGERANLRDQCETAVPTSAGELFMGEAADGGGVVTIKMPRSAHPALAEGALLGAPEAHSRHNLEAVVAPQIDNTVTGTDFTAKSASGDKDKDKGDKDKKKKKKKKATPKKCRKLKGKAKKKCIKKSKKKKSPGCAAYKPGEQGAEAETTVVTDAATEKKPVEVTLPIDAGAGTFFQGIEIGHISHAYQNVQVDSKAKDTGLWVRLEMPANRDYDLFLNNPDGSTAAKAAGFNPHHEGSPAAYNDTSAGGHTEATAEQLDGIKTADCQGYTVDAATASGEGGDLTLKLWLGPANYDPAAQES